jgi:cytochrome P450
MDMEEYFGLPYLCFYGSCFLLAVVARVLLLSGEKAGPQRLPPGPGQLPVIGSLHHLRRGLPHHTIRELSLRHGPLMLLRICERTAIVVSSAEAVGEMLKGHDAAFSERPSSPCIEELSRDGQGVIFAPYGDHWRLLRRILMTELLSKRRVESFRHIREEEAARLVSSLSSLPPGQPVDMDERLEVFVADSSVRAILGDRLPNRAAFLRMIKAGQEPSSLFDLRDLFPSSWLVQMLPRSRKAERHRQVMFRLMDDILASHSQRRSDSQVGGGAEQEDMVDVLLRIQKEGDLRVSLNHGVIRAALIVSNKLSSSLDRSLIVTYTF